MSGGSRDGLFDPHFFTVAASTEVAHHIQKPGSNSQRVETGVDFHWLAGMSSLPVGLAKRPD